MRKRPTLKEIARLSRVDPTTVSKILNGREDCYASQATWSRVKACARKLNYVPNVFGKILKGDRTRTIALLTQYSQEEETLLTALEMERLVHAHEYRTFFCQLSHRAADVLSLIEDLIARQVDGFILLKEHTPAVMERVRQLVEDNYPLVAVDTPITFPVDRVDGDRFASAQIAIQHLINCGRRKIVFICSDIHNGSVAPRYDGYRRTLEKNKIRFRKNFLLAACSSYQHAVDAVTNIIRKGAVPDGVFGYNNETAIGAMYALRKAKIRIPEEVAVVAFGEMAVSAFLSDTPLSTVSFAWQKLAREAVKLLFERLDNPGPAKKYTRKVIKPILTQRKSTKQ